MCVVGVPSERAVGVVDSRGPCNHSQPCVGRTQVGWMPGVSSLCAAIDCPTQNRGEEVMITGKGDTIK